MSFFAPPHRFTPPFSFSTIRSSPALPKISQKIPILPDPPEPEPKPTTKIINLKPVIPPEEENPNYEDEFCCAVPYYT